ncbi:hypothetical protein [Bacillus sp. SG-1]|uniref:hypothetical protein n=1 Tax=Bacillus sp. SG-1 TaxID=161544 RepID=UPI0012E9B30A|nr:hypothetical protein [Bacillus sp. SG-1]
MHKPLQKVLLLLFILFSTGCQSPEAEKERYIVWMEVSQQNQDLAVSAYKRLREANIEFKFDDEGNLLIKKSDSKKAVMCCS